MKKIIAIIFTGVILSIGFAQARPVACVLGASIQPSSLYYLTTYGINTGVITGTNFLKNVTGSGSIIVPKGTYTLTSGTCTYTYTVK